MSCEVASCLGGGRDTVAWAAGSWRGFESEIERNGTERKGTSARQSAGFGPCGWSVIVSWGVERDGVTFGGSGDEVAGRGESGGIAIHHSR